jgi:hypothetical protein
MSIPSLPSGYDVTKHVNPGRSDCHLTVGFDREHGRIPRFLVQLHYQADTAPVRWESIARMDHNETAALGHNVYQEGLHVDVSRRDARTVHLDVSHAPLSPNRGAVIRGCVDYFRQYAGYFVDVFEGDRSPGGPPRWSDGGDSPRTLITPNPVDTDMSQEDPEEILTVDELTDVLADATGSTPEEIERGAEELEIAPPYEATVVDE